jgi:hypothetical protein
MASSNNGIIQSPTSFHTILSSEAETEVFNQEDFNPDFVKRLGKYEIYDD